MKSGNIWFFEHTYISSSYIQHVSWNSKTQHQHRNWFSPNRLFKSVRLWRNTALHRPHLHGNCISKIAIIMMSLLLWVLIYNAFRRLVQHGWLNVSLQKSRSRDYIYQCVSINFFCLSQTTDLLVRYISVRQSFTVPAMNGYMNYHAINNSCA